MNAFQLVFFATGALFFAMAAVPGDASPPQKPAFRDIPYGLPLNDGAPLAMILRGQRTWLGDFDKQGNFIRNPNCPANLGANGGSLLPRFVWCDGNQSFVYEHRSGRLIKATMVAERTGKKLSCYIVPEIGSTIVDIQDIDLKKPDPDRRIWNKQDLFPIYQAARIKKYGDNPLPKAPNPPKAGIPPGWEFIPFSQLDTAILNGKVKPSKPALPVKPPMYIRAIGEFVEFGHLSDQGDFVPNPDLPMVARSGILGNVHFSGQISYNNPLIGIPRYYTIPQPAKPGVQRQEEDGPEEVYEYRAGRLIKGKLQLSGNFVPELGSKIIDFKEIDPQTERRRIYNLPGILRPVK